MYGKNAFSYPIPVSEKTQYLIRWLMEPNSQKRPQSVHQVQEFLKKPFAKANQQDAVSSDEMTQMPDAEPAGIRHKDIRWKKWLPLAAIGALLCAAVIIFAVTRKQPSFGDAVDSTLVSKPSVEKTGLETKVEKMYFDSALGLSSYTGPVDKNRKPHGIGEAAFNDGRLYRGPFVHGKFEGDNAYFKYDNGDTFEGTFINNSFSKGKYTIKEDGSYFLGSFKNGQPDNGSWYDKNGKAL
jgi:hypothetical protein